MVGIDEHTALTLDFSDQSCRVVGRGAVTLIRDGQARVFAPGPGFPMSEIGAVSIPEASRGIRPDVWAEAVEAQRTEPPQLSEEAEGLIADREEARRAKDWRRADMLRDRLSDMGYAVVDTPDGPRWEAA